ncbi:MAG: PEP-CTERM sorting domain-containing protein [Terriglobia bacterium]
MKIKMLLVISCLLCFGTLASAANMFVDFTQTPTAFNFDANWATQSSTATTFTGSFLSTTSENGSDLVAIVNENNPSELLDTLSLNFTTDTSDGQSGNETFSGSVMTGINGGSAIPAGAIVELATGSSVGFTPALFAAGAFPSNITLQEQANSPTNATPEPGSLVLFGTALIGLSLVTRRRLLKSA